MTKQQYRRKMSALRLRLKQEEVAAGSRKITESFFNLPGLENYLHYLAYLPVNNEVDTRPLLSRLISLGKKVYVPRCDAGQGKMNFYRIACFSNLKPGYCGIDEPCPDSSEIFINQGRAAAVCILPGLAFDHAGYRVGYGRGFFDRYLQQLAGPMPLLVGFAYDFQMVDSLPGDDWDIPVDMVITDEKIIQVAPESVSRA